MTITHPFARTSIGTLVLVFVATVLGCGGGTSELHLPDVTGGWTLKTVNGAPPPGLVQQRGDTLLELLSDGYTLNANGSYTESGMVRTTTMGSAVVSEVHESGAWALSKTAILLAPSDPPGTAPYSASIGTGILTFNFGTLVLVYSR